MERVERHGNLFEFHGASAVSGMDAGGRVPAIVAGRTGRVRRVEGIELVLAEHGWSDDQSAAGRGKKQVQTLRIEPNPAPSEVY